MNQSNIIISDNSSLTAALPACNSEESAESLPQTVAANEMMGAKQILFLCYAKENSNGMREFRERLRSETWVDPWFDEEDILPGQMWEGSVTEAVHNSHAVIVFIRTEVFLQGVEARLGCRR